MYTCAVVRGRPSEVADAGPGNAGDRRSIGLRHAAVGGEVRRGLLVTLAMLVAVAATHGTDAEGRHVMRVDQPLLLPEDGLLLGNGDLSVSVYQDRDRILWRFGKGDVWDRRIDRSEDPRPPHIDEIAHGIAVEGWKCPPYGDAEPVALSGTDNPERMKELCRGAPPSYTRRPYPCPKPVGELALQLPPDLPGLTVSHELTIGQGILRTTCRAANGVEVRLECFIPPEPNVLVVRWELLNWSPGTAMGNAAPPLRFHLYRWPDPDLLTFAQDYYARYGHAAFLTMDHAKVQPLPRPTTRRVGEQWCVEQTFPPDPTFPDGFSYLLAPTCPRAAVEPVDLGASGEARLWVTPPADAPSGTLVVAVPTSSDEGGAEAELARVNDAMAPGVEDAAQRWESAAMADAVAFWQESSFHTDDPAIEGLWYATYHARRCTTRAGRTPPGLFLPSTVRDFSHWHGDYHSNYNYEQPFYGDYGANHLELGDAYFDGMRYFLQMGRLIAERYYGARGAFIQLTGYPILAEDDVLGAVPMGRMAYMTGWAANQYWQRYLYTLDRDWLAAVGYPVLRDCALFYLDTMAKGDDGLYHYFPSNQGEDGFTGNPKDYTDRGQVMRHLRYCLRSAIAASEVLGTDEELRAQWRDRLGNAAGDDGQPPEKLEGLARHFAEANPPEFGPGRPFTQPEDPGDATPWPGADSWLDLWYAGQYPMIAVPSLRAGAVPPHRAYEGLRRIVERWQHPNGLVWAMAIANYGHAGAWTETLGVCAPLQEMLLQSYGGVLRLFPAWPLDVPAEVGTFRAEGAFLVSASCSAGGIGPVDVLSQRGGACRLYPPWPSGIVVETAEGVAVAVRPWAEGIVEFDTEAGRTYRIRPAN